MAIKDILVHLSDEAACAARVDAAAALAEAHDAHLTGLYTLWVPPLPGYVATQIGEELVARQRAVYTSRAEDASNAFSERARRVGIPFEARTIEGRVIDVLIRNTRYSDLVIMGRHEETAVERPIGVVEAVVLGSGKPVLVLPDEGAPQGIGTHVTAAWNGSREAVRAIDAALPLLERAERVDVIAVNPRGVRGTHGDVPGADLAAHLARHGVRAEAQAVDSSGRSVGETLLARAHADGANLLVMGAYGHARWREVVMGGVTAHVLRDAPIPVLMAH